MSVHVANGGQLVFGHHLGLEPDVKPFGDGGSSAGVVAGQHDRGDAHFGQLAHSLRRIGPQLVTHGDETERDAFAIDGDGGLALILEDGRLTQAKTIQAIVLRRVPG
ncbi:hypothetical protein MGSAQ_003048 [marine sediment metagenome]|uniref:Uncharacterized protein n=1 Tax=marine sediment metagenome TaxID=412755 RepID=A0A1B6NR73_9ZZZZ